jgi:hypothetical protein
MRKLIIYTLLLFGTAFSAFAQDEKAEKRYILPPEEEITDTYLDTVSLAPRGKINNYTMIGIHYGVSLSNCMWTPSMKQEFLLNPVHYGITYTRYGKMFGYMPFFGFQAGILYSQDGYKFKEDKDTGYTPSVEGATQARISVIEVPVLSHFHIDFWKMKIMFNLGCYAGYRLSIERFQLFDKDKYSFINQIRFKENQYSFLETDNRWDYGIKGGIGFGLIFDPIEIHIMAAYKHSFSSLYEPDHYSKYYYRFAYPSNIVVSAGVHFQLTKRTGKTKPQLKKLAKEMVYGNSVSENW